MARLTVVSAALLVAAALPLRAQAPEGKGKYPEPFSWEVTATRPDAAGKQHVVVKLTVQEGWFAYANPASTDEDFGSAAARLKVTTKKGLRAVDVAYPAGKTVKLVADIEINIYTGKLVLEADVLRTPGDNGPLEVELRLQGNELRPRICFPPWVLKTSIP